jgi:hypothetical protein
MTPRELAWLEARATGLVVAEVGSYMGRSTKALAANAAKVYAIDDWRGPRTEEDTLAGTDLRRSFLTNLADEIAAGIVEPMHMASVQAAKRVGHVDMVFIDGGHEQGQVTSDIAAWRAVADKLTGHDMYMPGVAAALRAELPDAEQAMESIWWIPSQWVGHV